MKISDRVREGRKLQLGTLILTCLIGGFGCGGSELSTELEAENQDVAVVLKKSAGPRTGICWKEKSRLKEIELQRLGIGRARRGKLGCNLLTRRALALKKQILAMQ